MNASAEQPTVDQQIGDLYLRIGALEAPIGALQAQVQELQGAGGFLVANNQKLNAKGEVEKEGGGGGGGGVTLAEVEALIAADKLTTLAAVEEHEHATGLLAAGIPAENTTLGIGAGVLLKGTSRANVSIGYNAMHNATTGVKFTICIGNGTGNSLAAGAENNILVGQETGRLITTGTGHVGVGINALYHMGTASGSTAIGVAALEQDVAGSNVAVGANAGTGINGAEGTLCVAIGKAALQGAVHGESELTYGASKPGTVAIGAYCMQSLETGFGNVGIGHNCLYTNKVGNENTAIGRYAMRLSTGSGTVAIGYGAGEQSTGNSNVYIGNLAGQEATAATGNVFIGNRVGETAGAVENKLRIHNSNSAEPLLSGDFSARTLRVYGTLSATAITYPEGSVGTAALASEAVTAAKIAKETITKTLLSAEVQNRLLVVGTPAAPVAREAAKAYEPSATEPMQVTVTLTFGKAEKYKGEVIVGGKTVLVFHAKPAAAELKETWDLLVPAGATWEVKVAEGSTVAPFALSSVYQTVTA